MPHRTREYHPFRAVLGLTALIAGITGMVGLYLVEIPSNNLQPLLVGLGVVLGWGTSVVQSEFGSTATGRKLADKAAEQLEQMSFKREEPKK